MAKLIQEYISESASRFPDKKAVEFKSESLTYKELDENSNRLARLLKERGVKKGDRVSFCLHKSIQSVLSIAAIAKADAIYVPLNAQAPRARIETMIEDSRPALILCDTKTKPLVSGLGEIFNFSVEWDEAMKKSEEVIVYENKGDECAYILYTSGSTGKPKGVMISHANIINATYWAVAEFGINENDRMSQHPPFHFDLSTFDLYCAFASGSALVLIPEELSLFPGQLMKYIEDKNITIWDSVPSVMIYLSTAGIAKPERMTSVKKIFFNGEGFPTKYLAEWMKTYPEKEFINMYGPTETTVQCSFYRIPVPPTDLTKLVPIGKATGGMEIFVVDGELYVGGKGVGLGYWNNPQKTAESFIEFPGKGRVYKTGDLVRQREDGNYEFIGRKDNQVKIRGNRIELGDVDAALYGLPYINEAAALALPDVSTGGNKLVAFVDLKDEKPESDIKTDVSKLIPNYMIPDEIVEMKLPKTSTGKIDRPKLKEIYGNKK